MLVLLCIRKIIFIEIVLKYKCNFNDKIKIYTCYFIQFSFCYIYECIFSKLKNVSRLIYDLK